MSDPVSSPARPGAAPESRPDVRADWCAIDFGTSNSALALADAQAADGVRLVPLEGADVTLPSAVFYDIEDLPRGAQAPRRLYGRAALAAYREGREGRLMRSIKSILGSALAGQATDIGAGHAVRGQDVVGHLLGRLLEQARVAAPDRPLPQHAVLGRPVHFVDDDPQRDAQAQAELEAAARAAGLREVAFQFEPIAAALDHEAGLQAEERVLVADIGGGTSDFSIVRVGPQRRARLDRADDILASHGVHVAGTDFDRHIDLALLLPACGYRTRGPSGREVPSRIYFDLATWHLVHAAQQPSRVAEIARMKGDYADARHHARLLHVLREQLGHALLARAEGAKIALSDALEAVDAVAATAAAELAVDDIERGLRLPLDAPLALAALQPDLRRIADALEETLRRAGLRADQVDTLYFTGGSTGLRPLTAAIAARCPQARVVHGDRLASVARGLGLQARRLYGA
ncbi:Hsp70 family protein [Pseudaquabacterium rugosum]|jgi:hypothetical chaperone protein|uniref:Hsp70 family protein n=1 Tax=Pseudaquabacterium rugosum TaxID=2984194 RepID=A0ABU9BEP4_9BURK